MARPSRMITERNPNCKRRVGAGCGCLMLEVDDKKSVVDRQQRLSLQLDSEQSTSFRLKYFVSKILFGRMIQTKEGQIH
jgi:hypothetical protein